MPAIVKKAQVEELLVKVNLYPDRVRVQKDGIVVLQWGYFYSHGRSAHGYADKLKAAVPEAIIERTEDHFNAWPRRSWFEVAFRLA